jgi:RNA polymerase sigma factor (sigma-70 family)
MADATDMELVRDFVRQNSEPAFEMLVQRHVSLVYSAALRRTSNPSHAEEITQAVFVILARKAARLGPGTVLAGWLYQTARMVSATYLRGESRRRQREHEAYMQATSDTSAPDTAWEQVAPLLEEAMGELGEQDRNAVVLRFFENKSTREIAQALNVKESAAHKRVTRSLEKLRTFFARRGVALSTAAIAATVTANSVQAAPAGLTTSALGAATSVSATASPLVLAKATLKAVAWVKAKFALGCGAAVLLVGSAAVVATHPSGPQRYAGDTIFLARTILTNPPRVAACVYSRTYMSVGVAGTNYETRYWRIGYADGRRYSLLFSNITDALNGLNAYQGHGGTVDLREWSFYDGVLTWETNELARKVGAAPIRFRHDDPDHMPLSLEIPLVTGSVRFDSPTNFHALHLDGREIAGSISTNGDQCQITYITYTINRPDIAGLVSEATLTWPDDIPGPRALPQRVDIHGRGKLWADITIYHKVIYVRDGSTAPDFSPTRLPGCKLDVRTHVILDGSRVRALDNRGRPVPVPKQFSK